VGEGDVVAEIGTGVGTYALMAVRAGAERVYALEPDRIGEAARQIVRANGMEERIVLLQGRAEEIALPEPVDVLITEDFGPLFYEGHLNELLLGVRRRFLKPEGRTIPHRVELAAAPWGGPAPDPGPRLPEGTLRDVRWELRAGSGDLDLSDIRGLDLSVLEGLAANTPDPSGVPPGGLLAGPEILLGWDLADMRPGSFRGEASWSLERAGAIWGLGLWMEMELAPGIVYSNAPDRQETSWGQAHLPLTPSLEVEAGERVRGSVAARSDPSGRVWWSWGLAVEGRAEEVREGNTFRSLPMLDRRRRLLRDRRLPLSPWASADAFLLERLTRRSLEEAAGEAAETFPDLFRDPDHAQARAVRLRERYLELPPEEVP